MSDRGSRRLHKLLLGSTIVPHSLPERERGGEVEIERGGEGGRGGGGGAITPFFSADLEDGGKVRTAAISFQFVREDGPWMIRRALLVRSEFCLSLFFCLLCDWFLDRKEKRVSNSLFCLVLWQLEGRTEDRTSLRTYSG